MRDLPQRHLIAVAARSTDRGMTPADLIATIAASANASLAQVEIYAPRARWWHRRVRISPVALSQAIAKNAATVVLALTSEHYLD